MEELARTRLPPGPRAPWTERDHFKWRLATSSGRMNYSWYLDEEDPGLPELVSSDEC